MKRTIFVLATVCGSLLTSVAFAAEGAHFADREWDFENITHQWDKQKIYRGYQVASQVCMSCHSFKYLSHRDLMKVGFTEDEVKTLAANMGITMDTKLKSLLTDEDAQAAYGKKLPDLSTINKARQGGADYIYALLTGYPEPEDIPADFTGVNYNLAFPGHNIAMPNPLIGGLVEYEDGTESSVAQMSEDVTYFMQWAAEPERTTRQHLGIYVLLYVLLFTALAYLLKRAVWRDIH